MSFVGCGNCGEVGIDPLNSGFITTNGIVIGCEESDTDAVGGSVPIESISPLIGHLKDLTGSEDVAGIDRKTPLAAGRKNGVTSTIERGVGRVETSSLVRLLHISYIIPKGGLLVVAAIGG